MVKFLAARQGNTLRAMDEKGEAAIAKLSQGKLVMVEVRQERHLEHHRLYWVLMGIVWDQCDTERWPTVDDFSDSVKVMAGLRRSIFLPDGTVIYSPGSIAF